MQRLRERAALLGADELAEVIAVYDIPTTGTAVTSSNTGLPSQAGLEAASTGFSLLIHHPKWVSVRGIALRLHEKHLADRSFSVHDPTDSRPSPLQDAHRVGAPPTPPCGPAEKPPADQPNNEE
ncbi:MAG: hypothetical protein HY286_13760 [Planctomycetes bacterium]|nr:hypothetical protein [Planctomycetota bacterium]